VHAAPTVSCAKVHKRNAHEHTGSAEAIRHSLRNGFTAYIVLSPAIGLSCHRHLAGYGASARLGLHTSARLDAGVEASGPHDFAVRCSAVRLRAQGIAHGSIKPALRSHLARGRCRVHRIPSRVNDDGQRPSVGRDGESYSLICISEKQKYFCERGWTTDHRTAAVICPSGKSAEDTSTQKVRARC
jgi:hypothetical protein